MTEASSVWIDGALRSGDEHWISAFDHGLTVGDGVFESLKVVAAAPFALRRHLARLRASADRLGITIPFTDRELRDAVAATIAANDVTGGRIRITVTGGVGPLGPGRESGKPTVIVAASPMPKWGATAHVVTVPWRRNEHGATVGIKTTSYAENVIALEYARDHGADEALFANTANDLCEGTSSNIFIESNGKLLTPPLSSGCLGGITRELLIEILDVTEQPIPIKLLHATQEAFLSSSTRDIQPIASIDGIPVAQCPGPLTVQAQNAFAELQRSSQDP